MVIIGFHWDEVVIGRGYICLLVKSSRIESKGDLLTPGAAADVMGV